MRFIHALRIALLVVVTRAVLDGRAPAQTWNSEENGRWDTAKNWTPATVPNSPGATVVIPVTKSINVRLMADDKFTLNSLTYSSQKSGNSLISGRMGTLNFQGVNGSARASTITVASGRLTINPSITFNNGLVINTAQDQVRSTLLILNGKISSPTASFSLFKDGPGTLILNNTNDYKGRTLIRGGTLVATQNGALGATTNGTNVRTGGALGFSNNVNYTAKQSVTLMASTVSTITGAIVTVGERPNVPLYTDGNNTFNGPILITRIGRGAVTAPFAIDAKTSLTLNGAISQGDRVLAGINKTGMGNLIFNVANSYGGMTTVSEGRLIVTVNGALGAVTPLPTAATTVSDGATLAFNDVKYTAKELILIDGNGMGGQGAINNLSGTSTFDGAIRLQGNSAIGGEDETDLRLNGTISEKNGSSFGLTKVGLGTVTLNSANTYSGDTTVSAGILQVTANGAMGPGKATTSVSDGGNLTLSGGVAYNNQQALVLNGSGPEGRSIGALLGDGKMNSYAGPISMASDSTITVFKDGTLTLSAGISNQGQFTNAQLTKSGAGVLDLTGKSTYSGGTVVSAGTLLVNDDKTKPGTGTGPGNIDVRKGATLGGNGSIGGKVEVENDGFDKFTGIRPGNPGQSPGMLTINRGLQIDGGGTYLWELGREIDPLAGAVPGVDFSVIHLAAGRLNLDPMSALSLQFTDSAQAPTLSDPFWRESHVWDIIALDSPSQNASRENLGTILDASFQAGSFSTFVGSGAYSGDIFLQYVSASSVPEPGSLVQGLGALGIVAAAAWLRRARSQRKTEAGFQKDKPATHKS